MNYNGRIFRGRTNTDNGEVSGETRFHYFQEGDRLWGTYSGGSIVDGHLLGTLRIAFLMRCAPLYRYRARW